MSPGNAAARFGERSGRDGLVSAVAATETVSPIYDVPLSERFVVGAALLGCLDGLDALDIDRDLTDPRLRATAQAVRRLEADGRPVDVPAVYVTLAQTADVRWSRPQQLATFLAELVSVETVAVPVSAGWHGVLIREATARRRLVTLARLAEQLAAGSLDPMATTAALVEDVLKVAETLKRVQR